MEWVEKTGRSVDEAKERALDQLGVAETDAEVVVLAEPKTGLFGRVRGEARVRARVRPAEVRPKRVRRRRERGQADVGHTGSGRAGGTRTGRRTTEASRTAGGRASREASAARAPAGASSGENAASVSSGSRRRRRRRSGAQRPSSELVEPTTQTAPAAPTAETASAADGGAVVARPDRHHDVDEGGLDRVMPEKEGQPVAQGITLQEQAAVAKEFLEGLLDRYGLEATIEVRELDEETVELAAQGEGLGILVGPKGATVAALQDVTRTVVQRHFPNRTDRILVDVAGYRERRAAALRRFAADVAADVLESGSERALEPMSPADRKIIHDTVVTIDGVVSSSQGEEPNRFVVISPAP